MAKEDEVRVRGEDAQGKSLLRGWTIVACAFSCDALALGGRALFAVVLLDWERDFGWSRASISGAVSLLHISSVLSTPITGHIVDLFGARNSLSLGLAAFAVTLALTGSIAYFWQLYVFYGLLSGLCLGVLNLNVFSVAVMDALPPRLHGRAIGITTSGSTFGQLFLVPAFAFVARGIGWRLAYYIVAGLTLFMAPVTWFVLGNVQNKLPKEPGPAVPGESWKTVIREKLKKSLTNRYFWHLFFAFTICGISTTGFMETHIVAFCVHRGLAASDGAYAFGLLSAFNGIGILIAGFLSDRYSRPVLLGCIFLLRALCYLMMYFISNLGLLFSFSVLFGLVDYSVVPPVIGLVGRFVGKETVGLAMGILLASHSVGAAIGSSVGGSEFDRTQSYDIPIGLCAGLCVLASILCFLIPEELVRAQVSALTNAEFENTVEGRPKTGKATTI